MLAFTLILACLGSAFSLTPTLGGNSDLLSLLLKLQQNNLNSQNNVLNPSLGGAFGGLCGTLQAENARLKNMLSIALQLGQTQCNAIPTGGFNLNQGLTQGLNQGLFQSNPQDLLKKALQPKVSLKKVWVTPTPTMSTYEETSSHYATVTETDYSEIPIILRGKKIYTTIKDTYLTTGKRKGTRQGNMWGEKKRSRQVLLWGCNAQLGAI